MTMKTIENKTSKLLRINLNEEDRQPIVFSHCKDCTIHVLFEFTTGPNITKEYEEWCKLPKAERPMQQIIFDSCEGMKVNEHTSVDTLFVFNDCKSCTFVSETCDQALDLYRCVDMECKAILIKQFRLLQCRNVVLACNNECDIVSLHNETEPAITRRFHVGRTVASVESYKKAKAALHLEGFKTADDQRYA
ncbi:hypothetical protein PTSG_03943 [Salpingoeca rosetta]|uniref:C-CAP/cofactor C-like domain-containing protein n=1 Tax=Salpingoeca rosetta (strain ATCC 50818 / BSB-021) TaxID=946362 RepID=F2U7B7_SALR5|nr:uncharacterized protein PTSG_03943 [Salpingoeca rosetta]EGD83334.1 hypothetical protein PTSG_03943 [Salpingoeca rosetta]|eukprot:XP_004994838.1 hypothetical protein PTSG_03943 [Salpingoeca rosetta]